MASILVRVLLAASSLLLPATAVAQKSNSQLQSEINSNLPSSQPNVLTAAALRGVLSDMVTSNIPGIAFPAFNGLQFGLVQSGLGSPGGTMSGYVVGDRITLQCTNVTFSTSPIIGVTAVSGGAVTSATLAIPGVTTGIVLSGTANCSQASTTGSGTGFTITSTLGLYASYIQPASIVTGGSGNANGNLFLNWNPSDTGLFLSFAGDESTFIGSKAGTGLLGNSNGNTAIGHNSCGSGGTGGSGAFHVCIGQDAGRNNEDANGSNVLIGAGAGRNIANGSNTYVGGGAGGFGGVNSPGNLSGNTNTGIGAFSLQALTSGNGNTCLGGQSCSAIVTGNENIIISATNGVDHCNNGDESNVFAICPGAGRVLTITGGGTPSTSVAKFPGFVQFTPITISALPACAAGNKGEVAFVSDTTASAAATFHGTVAGSGVTTVNSLVSCNGSNWQYD